MWGWLLFYVVLLLQALDNIRHPQFDAICTSRNTRTAKLGQQAMFSEGCKDHCWQICTPALKIKIFRNPRSELGSWRWVKNSIASRHLVQCRSYKDHWAPRFVRVLHRKMVDVTKIIARFQYVPIQLHANASVHDLFGNIWGDFGPQTTYLAITERLRRTRADLLFFLRLLYTGQVADETLFCVLPFRQWDMRIMNNDTDFNMCNPCSILAIHVL